MRVGMVHLKLDLVLDHTGGVDLDDAGRAGFGDHGSAVGEALEGMDLDTFPAIAIAGGGVVLPQWFCRG